MPGLWDFRVIHGAVTLKHVAGMFADAARADFRVIHGAVTLKRAGAVFGHFHVQAISASFMARSH